MEKRTYIPFTEEMKRDYTILTPTMLPMHFKLIASVLRTYGYKMEVLENSGPEVAETGLKYVHNDTCYPAILVIGQFITALDSGRWDPHKTALILFQTGGGCRASNYIPLLRKALARAGYGYVPVISFSLAGIEKHPGFRLTVPKLHGMLYGVLYGDLLMSLVNQCRPYEINTGEAQRLAGEWTERLGLELGAGRHISYRKVKENYLAILRSFGEIPKRRKDTVKVGVVGEIFVKYSPLGNNDLETFLVGEDAEVVVPGLLDFCMYCAYNNIEDFLLYGRSPAAHAVYRVAYRFLLRKKHDLIDAFRKEGSFTPPTPFENVVALRKGYIGIGTKMGRGGCSRRRCWSWPKAA